VKLQPTLDRKEKKNPGIDFNAKATKGSTKVITDHREAV
jgi:hypothetical protein